MNSKLIKLFRKSTKAQVVYQGGSVVLQDSDMAITLSEICHLGAYDMQPLIETKGKSVHYNPDGAIVSDGLRLEAKHDQLPSDEVLTPREIVPRFSFGLTIPTKFDLDSLTDCASTDPCRANLMGVWIDGPDIMATDGCKLVMIKDCASSDHGDPVFLPSRLCRAMAILKWNRVIVEGDSLNVRVINLDNRTESIAWHFSYSLDSVQFRRVIPADCNGGLIDVDFGVFETAKKVKADMVTFNGSTVYSTFGKEKFHPKQVPVYTEEKSRFVSEGVDAVSLNAGYLEQVFRAMAIGKRSIMSGRVKDLCCAVKFENADALGLVMPIVQRD
jgi:hypothetical protein